MKILKEPVGNLLMGLERTNEGVKLITNKDSHMFWVEDPYDDYEDISIEGDLSLLGEKILAINYEYRESLGSGSCNSHYTHSIEIVFMLKTIDISITRREAMDIKVD